MYGVTTVPSRRGTLLPRTLASLKLAGFPEPRLFVDGDDDAKSWKAEFGCEATCRCPRVRTAANWVLSMYELYLRKPDADRFAIFQDDMVALLHLREYLDSMHMPKDRYWNLYTFPQNLNKSAKGWSTSNQLGYGAVALVFSRAGIIDLFSQRHLAERPQDKDRGWRAIDGGIVTAMAKAGYKELVHNPSLVQHTGDRSVMGSPKHAKADSFPGELFDARGLIV